MADKLLRTTVVMLFLMILALFSGCGTNGTSIAKADSGKQVTVKAGETVTLTLESNPTTGYSWQVLKIDNAVLVQDGDTEYKQAAGTEGMAGAGGTETFRFNAVSAGETSLELGYMRPWENVAPLETFTVKVIVK